MGFTCGIVGLPNVGKSTLFNALTNAGIAAANYPFCTIEPNVGVVAMPDARLALLENIVKPERVVPTTMQFVDIAGLVKGAASGEGLGNQFLAHIRETQAIAHVVRCFENSDIVHVHNAVNPLHDIDIIHTELALADLDTVERALIKTQKNLKSGSAEAKLEAILLNRVKEHLNNNQPIRTLEFTAEETNILSRFGFITAKPVLYIANIDDNGYENNQHVEAVIKLATEENAKVVVLCAETEAALSTMEDTERQEFMSDLNLTEPGLNKLIRAGYELLSLQTYFTAGVKEVRAWTIKVGQKAPEAAGVIHTDFEKGFIRAEVIAFDDFIKYQGEQGAREAGKLRLEGKDYVVCDGDVMHFRFNV